MLTTSDVPSVDIADLSSDDPARLDRAAEALRTGYGDFGVVTISGHGIEPSELDAYYLAFREVLARPAVEKAAWHRADIWYQRGWTPPNTEAAVVAQGVRDFKECWFASPTEPDADAAACFPELFAANVWPEGANDFQRLHLSLGRALHETGCLLLRGCERALGLDAGTFDALTAGAAHVTRALAYLPLDEEEAARGLLWGEEHTDFNLLTILAGGRFYDPSGNVAGKPDDRSGLYLRTRPTAEHPRGRMVPGRAPADHIVSQVGQQLEILTGGTFLATPHVIKAPGVAGWSRTNMAHFVHVHPLKTLAPLPPFRTPAAVEAYRPPVLAGTYALKTLVDISLAPPETLDSFGYRHYGRLAGIRSEGEW